MEFSTKSIGTKAIKRSGENPPIPGQASASKRPLKADSNILYDLVNGVKLLNDSCFLSSIAILQLRTAFAGRQASLSQTLTKPINLLVQFKYAGVLLSLLKECSCTRLNLGRGYYWRK